MKKWKTPLKWKNVLLSLQFQRNRKNWFRNITILRIWQTKRKNVNKIKQKSCCRKKMIKKWVSAPSRHNWKRRQCSDRGLHKLHKVRQIYRSNKVLKELIMTQPRKNRKVLEIIQALRKNQKMLETVQLLSQRKNRMECQHQKLTWLETIDHVDLQRNGHQGRRIPVEDFERIILQLQWIRRLRLRLQQLKTQNRNMVSLRCLINNNE